ncbi:MAG: mercuric reductase [Gemmatimonadaceae bacterium]
MSFARLYRDPDGSATSRFIEGASLYDKDPVSDSFSDVIETIDDRGAPSPLERSASADERRRANVWPDDWKTPEPAQRYQLVVIGGGTAGLVSAAIAAGLGARVALVERHSMGGDCLNVGCVPSKGIIRAARSWEAARKSNADFGGPRATAPGQFGVAMARMRELRAGMSDVDSAARFRALGVDVFLGDAKFAGRERAVVRDRYGVDTVLRFRRAIVATGARASAPNIDGLEEAGYLTNETVFDLDTLPARLLVIGGGPIGCELAQTFARFGSQVTLLNAAPHLLPREDRDASAVVERALSADGVALQQSVTILSARRAGDTRVVAYESAGQRFSCSGDHILVASGRAPNVENMGLEEAGIRYDKKGIKINNRFRTSNTKIFAIGDCSSKYQFTHAADAQARRAVPNALFYGVGGGKANDIVMPWCTYTQPEVAHVGMTAHEVAEAGDEIESITVPLSEVDRARLDGETDGFLRVHLKSGSDRILGATLVADHAGEMIGELTVAMTNGLGLTALGNTIHPYPTQAEVIRKAADAYARRRLTPRAKWILGLYFKMLA